MMDKQKGNYVFECDTCGEVFDSKTSDFDLAQLKRKEAGWTAFKEKEEWKHNCPKCKT